MVLFLCASGSQLFAAPSGPSFSEAWYREVILGELEVAADLYERLYGETVAAARAVSAENKRRAALRAGLCRERLGDARRAREAYSWLVRTGPVDDPLVDEARLRLLDLPEKPAAGPPREPAAQEDAAREGGGLSTLLERRLEQLGAALTQSRQEILRRSERIQGERRLQERLAQLGVEIRLPEGSTGSAAVGLSGVEFALDLEDRASLRQALAERYFLRGLRALRDRDPDRAVRDLKLSIEMMPDRREAAHWLRIAEGLIQPMAPIAEHAGLRIQDRQAVRDLGLLKQMEERAARARSVLSQGRQGPAREELEKLLRWEDWANGAAALPVEAKALSLETERRILSDLGTGRGHEDLRQECRRASGRLIGSCEELADLSLADGRQPLLSPPAGGERAAGSRGATKEKVLQEMERLLVRGEDLYGQRTPGSGDDLWRRPFQELQILSQWFPDLDADRRFQRLAQEYLGR